MKGAVLLVPGLLKNFIIGCHTVIVRNKDTIPSLDILEWKN